MMTNDEKNRLIELYKTTLEELHHHDRIYWQALLGFAIITSVFLAGVSFLLGKDSPIRPEYFPDVKWGIFSFVIPLTFLFALAISRINIRVKISLEVIRRIEGRLRAVENTGQGSELGGLLVREELDKSKFDNWFAKYRFCFYIPLSLSALVALGFLIFVFMN